MMTTRHVIGIILVWIGVALWIKGLPGNWIAFAPIILVLGILTLVVKPQI